MALILYAEDDELMAEFVRLKLAEDGHVTGIVMEGEAAFAAIKIKRPDLVILDCNLPGLPGVEILRRMRMSRDLYDIPVLILTGRRSESDVALAKQAGANEYLKKPFDPEELKFIVEEMLLRQARRLRATG